MYPDIVYAHDGRGILFTAGSLPPYYGRASEVNATSSGEAPSDKDQHTDTLYIKIIFRETLPLAEVLNEDLEADKAFSAVNIIMTSAFGGVSSFVQVGRTFFTEGRAHDLGRGVEAWTGGF